MRRTAPAGTIWGEEATLAPELRALLACGRVFLGREGHEQLSAALAACPDVEHLCRKAVEHGMLGHLHRVITGGPPGTAAPALMSRLTELQRVSAQRNLRQTGQLLRVLDALKARGIPTMPLKGPAWAERLYGDVTLRTWADLDILVPYEQVQEARDVLLEQGFADSGPYNEAIATRRAGGWGQIALSAEDRGVHVELHWEVTAGFCGRSLRPESLFEQGGRLRLLGREVATPSPVDLLLVTCVDGARDRWSTVERLMGLAVQVRERAAGEWPEVISRATSAGCRRRTITGIAHACRVFRLDVPPAVDEAVAADTAGRTLVRSLGADSLGGRGPAGPRRHLTALFWRFATEDSFTAGLGHALARFFRPGPEDWECVTLSPRFAWLYYPLRPGRLVAKWAGRML